MMGSSPDNRSKRIPPSPRGKPNESMSKYKSTDFKSEGRGDGNHHYLSQNLMLGYMLPDVKEITQKMDALLIDPEESHPHKGPCAVCGLNCKTCCAGCKKVFYCAKKHQQVHWAKHKLECRPFSIPTQYPSGWYTSTKTSGRESRIGIGNKAKESDFALELKYMVATKEIEGGKTLFSEKPLLILPNYPQPAIANITDGSTQKKCCCLGCYKQFSVPGRFVPLDVCKRCLLPLCSDCLSDLDQGKQNSGGGDCSHKRDECNAIADAVAKNRQFMIDRNDKLGQSADLVKDFSILRILMLYRSSCSRWQSFIDLKSNPRYTPCLKFQTDEMKEWLAVDYPISENYLTSLKDKTIKLEEVVQIFVIFSQVSYTSTQVRVLYPTQVWIPHACAPNSEPYSKEQDPSHTIYVKTIDAIKADGIIGINYMKNYEEGCSKAAIRLFAATGMYCADPLCTCRMQSSLDKSVGVRCSLFSSKDVISCPGILCPVMEPPNPEKQNLGMLIYVKSKSWNCNKCRKSEKFSSIQKQVKEIGDKMKNAVEKFVKDCECLQGRYQVLKDLLNVHFSEHHWLHWKACKATLTSCDRMVGNGHIMLTWVIGMPEGDAKSEFIKITRFKVELYGSGIIESLFPKTSQSLGILALLAKRHGKFSSERAPYLFDAFYANLIVFAENFKQIFIKLSNRTSTMAEAVIEGMRCLHILLGLLDEATISLCLFPTQNMLLKASISSKMIQVFKKVCSKAVKNRANVLQFIREFLEIYATQDGAFIATILSKLKPMKDGLEEIFDTNGRHYPALTFGTAYDTGEKKIGKKKMEKEKTPDPFTGWRYQSEVNQSDSDDEFGFYRDILLDDEDDDDLNAPSASVDYYEQLLTDTIRDRMYAEEILKNLFK